MTRLLLLALPFFLPAYVLRFHIGPLPTTVLELAILALTIAWLAERKTDGLKNAWKKYAAWRIPLGLWLATGLVAVATAALNGFDTLAALGLFRAYFLEPLIVFTIGADVLKKEDHTLLLRNITILAVGLTAYAALQYATGWGIPHPWSDWPGRRSTGPFPFPNALALLLVPFGAYGIALALKNTHRALGITLFAAATISSLLAQSDGGLIALAAALGTALLFKQKTRIPAILIGIALLITAMSLAPIREKLLFQEWSGKVRMVIWTESLTMLKDHPIFGAGLAAYPQAILPYHTATWMEVFQYPHNILLNLWSETGLLGLVVFAVLLLTWTRQTKNPALVLPVIAALLIHGLVDVPYFKNDLAVAFWILVLLTLDPRLKNGYDRHA